MSSSDSNSRNRRPPRLLTRSEAAAYCAISKPTFDHVCAVAPIALARGNARLQRFDIRDIDAWIESKKNLNDNQDKSKDDLISTLLS